MRCTRRGLQSILFLIGSLGGSVSSWAHSMYQSAVLLDFHHDTVGAELQLPVDRLSISFGQTVDAQRFEAERASLTTYVLSHVHPVEPDGRPFTVAVQSMEVQAVEKAPYLVVHLLFTPPVQGSIDRFNLKYDVITHEIVTHVVLVSLRSDDRNFISVQDPVLVGIIRGPVKSVMIDRSRRS